MSKISFHPGVSLSFVAIIFLMVLTYTNPLYILSILVFILLLLAYMGDTKRIKENLKYSLPTALLVILINPLVSNVGRTIIFSTGRLPIVGKVRISLEALAFGGNMAVKLITIFLIFALYGSMTDRDDSFSFFSKYAHKLTLTLSLTTNIIYRLKIELSRVRDVMELRGVNFHEKSIIKKIKSYYPLFKVLLITALEGSLDRAEALYSRGYGRARRTSYGDLNFTLLDKMAFVLNLILMVLSVYSFLTGLGNYEFYPTFREFPLRDLRFLAILNGFLLLYIVLIGGSRRWRFLKYKI